MSWKSFVELVSLLLVAALPSHASVVTPSGTSFQRVLESCPEAAVSNHSISSKLLCAGLCEATQRCSAFCFQKSGNFCQLNEMKYASNVSSAIRGLRTYLPAAGKEPYAAAVQHCQDLGLFLALPSNEIENSEVHALLKDDSWIGADIIGHGGVFHSSGSAPEGDRPLQYTAWRAGEPRGTSSEECVMMWRYSGKWNDDICATTYSFMCQFPVPGTCAALPASDDLACYRRSHF